MDVSSIVDVVILVAVTFAQEYEVRQVYIRSSARVYEVYYNKKKRDDREYLCTVRCGVAVREEEEEDEEASKNGVEPGEDDDPMAKKVKANGKGQTKEDDWVEVKSVPQLGQQVKRFLRNFGFSISLYYFLCK